MTTRTRKPVGIVVPMSFRKETARTFVYENGDEGIAVSTVYVTKLALGDTPPTNIVVTITPA